MWDAITYPFLNFNGATIEVCEWISKFKPHFTGHVVTYPCCEMHTLWYFQTPVFSTIIVPLGVGGLLQWFWGMPANGNANEKCMYQQNCGYRKCNVQNIQTLWIYRMRLGRKNITRRELWANYNDVITWQGLTLNWPFVNKIHLSMHWMIPMKKCQ